MGVVRERFLVSLCRLAVGTPIPALLRLVRMVGCANLLEPGRWASVLGCSRADSARATPILSTSTRPNASNIVTLSPAVAERGGDSSSSFSAGDPEKRAPGSIGP